MRSPGPDVPTLIETMRTHDAGDDFQHRLDHVRHVVGERRFALGVQIVINAVNMAATLLFVLVLDMSILGAAAASVVAEGTGLLLGVIIAWRITGGRPWLALVLVLGCGVIFVHAATLKVNQQIEKRDQEISALERSTAELRNSVAELGATDRVSRIGREAGMVFPDPEGIGYLSARRSSAAKAAQTFGPPAATWQPAPNPSTQNGDVLGDDGTLVERGTDVAAAGTAATDGAAEGTATGETATGEDASSSGTGTGAGTADTTTAQTAPETAQAPPADGATGTGDGAGATADGTTATGGATPSGGADPGTGG